MKDTRRFSWLPRNAALMRQRVDQHVRVDELGVSDFITAATATAATGVACVVETERRVDHREAVTDGQTKQIRFALPALGYDGVNVVERAENRMTF